MEYEYEDDGFEEDLNNSSGDEEEAEDDGFREDLQEDTPAQEELKRILEPTPSLKVQAVLQKIVDHLFAVVIIAIVVCILVIGVIIFGKMTEDGVDVGGVNRIEGMFEK